MPTIPRTARSRSSRLRVSTTPRRSPGRAVAIAIAFALVAPAARAEDRVDVRARDVELDARTREMVLEGDVRVDLAPFHLRSDRLRVKRDARGAVDVEGPGTLTFCPCLAPPVDVRFERATVAPPGDLLLTQPRLDVAGAPVLWAPWIWLRAPDRAGLLAPELAYRGADGVFAGGGVHLPWRAGDARDGLDLRAGGYFEGGAAVSASLVTPASATRVAWDHLRGDGLAIDARGAIAPDDARDGAPTLAWDADAIRGARGVRATTELDAAARPFDRARGEAAWRDGGWTIASGVRTTTARGGAIDALGAAGPVAAIRRADAIASAGAYDLAAEGGALREPGRTLSFARGEAGSLLADRWGPLGASLALRGAGDVASRSQLGGASLSGADGAASARARVALPVARVFDASEPNDPWVHRVEPAIDAALLAARGDDLLGVAPGRGGGAIHGEAWLGEATLASAVGRWGARVGADASISGGALGSLDPSAPRAPRALLRWRVAASTSWLALASEGARVAATTDAGGPGGAFVARARVGERAGLHATLYAAERDGVDPVAARALTDAPLEPSGGFLASEGWTGGAGARVPWTAWLASTAGADADLTAKLLVAARAGLELRDRCGCLRVRLDGAHRIGRDGVDVWLAIEITPHAP